MAKQRYVDTKIWEDNWFSNLDQIEQLVFLYFLTNPTTNIVGVYELSKATISRATGLETQMLNTILERFERDKKVFYVEGWVVLPNFIKHQNYNSPKIRKGIEIELERIPDKVKTYIKIPYVYGIDTPSHSNTNSNTNSNKNTNTEIVSSKEDTFDKFWSAYPKKELKKKTLEIWKRKKLGTHLEEILWFITVAQKTDRWKKGYIKQPPAFLNGECWNDDISTYNDKVGFSGKSVSIIQ